MGGIAHVRIHLCERESEQSEHVCREDECVGSVCAQVTTCTVHVCTQVLHMQETLHF